MVTTSTALSIAAFAAGVTLMLVAHILIICWALRRGAEADADADQERAAADQERAAAADHGGGKGLSADEVETLPCHDFSASCAAAPDCAVCLEAFVAGERCRRLPRCEHSFHAKCVDPWLRKSRCCPVCRADVLPNGDVAPTTPALTAEMEMEAEAERRSAAALEMVAVERLQQYSWTLHSGIMLR